jgi:hypothetical protein
MHGIPAHRLFVIGAPRFEIYRRRQPTQAEARVRLGLPKERRLLLFCGAGAPFEETSLLKDLDAAISRGDLPDDLLVVYKPHPLRFARAAEKPFEAREYANVVLAPGTARKLTELDLYPDLLAAVNGLISPFSTMVIEGARHGLPALCVGYDDPGHANHDWSRAAFNLHTYVIRHGDWAVVCENRAAFLNSCQRLVAMLDEPRVQADARAAAEMVWKTGCTSVAQRIATAVHTIAAGRDADNSFAVTKTASGRRAPLASETAALSKD